MAGYIPTAAPLSVSGSFFFLVQLVKAPVEHSSKTKQLTETTFIALQSLAIKAKINAFPKVMLLKKIPSEVSRKNGLLSCFFFKSEIIRNYILS